MSDTVHYTKASELWNIKPEGQNNKLAGSTVDCIDVSYSVLIGGKYKRLLRNVNLHLEPVGIISMVVYMV